MRTIISGKDGEYLARAVTLLQQASCPLALTGAGISVNSDIADFRSPGGVWTRFSPDEYATLEVFRQNPQKAWRLYREMGRGLIGKKPNKAHRTLARLERANLIKAVITQNVDNLHQVAGSSRVFEIHGDHQHLQCLQCGDIVEVEQQHYQADTVPHCPHCNFPYKPNVVLFGEDVRHLNTITNIIHQCDLLLVIGTSARVYPAAALPETVKQRGGKIFEFNLEQTLGSDSRGAGRSITDFFFKGDLATTLPTFGEAALNQR
ncbi:SIR2 family NAD-dependent protein deacylase [Desulforhopalus singaporensis]|uniref:protein acetyllysine N-acetyltransferase n=1 Tax=Desulforhopalus singaporensis TaxID=91360 RepID=A0A1H0LYM6_9BACT|nr:Sir2 family NAD-dependent protein deacetylase [Desulforhopalus singaporensis]SDO73235.1 NAD-dependent deacetylase [Desulforhopalus singaporensis]